MGEYYDIVCHTCREYYSPSPAKVREIALNVRLAMAVGHFCTQHPGHELELRGDEYNYDATRGNAGVIEGYERVDVYAHDADAQYALNAINNGGDAV